MQQQNFLLPSDGIGISDEEFLQGFERMLSNKYYKGIKRWNKFITPYTQKRQELSQKYTVFRDTMRSIIEPYGNDPIIEKYIMIPGKPFMYFRSLFILYLSPVFFYADQKNDYNIIEEQISNIFHFPEFIVKPVEQNQPVSIENQVKFDRIKKLCSLMTMLFAEFEGRDLQQLDMGNPELRPYLNMVTSFLCICFQPQNPSPFSQLFEPDVYKALNLEDATCQENKITIIENTAHVNTHINGVYFPFELFDQLVKDTFSQVCQSLPQLGFAAYLGIAGITQTEKSIDMLNFMEPNLRELIKEVEKEKISNKKTRNKCAQTVIDFKKISNIIEIMSSLDWKGIRNAQEGVAKCFDSCNGDSLDKRRIPYINASTLQKTVHDFICEFEKKINELKSESKGQIIITEKFQNEINALIESEKNLFNTISNRTKGNIPKNDFKTGINSTKKSAERLTKSLEKIPLSISVFLNNIKEQLAQLNPDNIPKMDIEEYFENIPFSC